MTLLLSLLACFDTDPVFGCTEIGCSDGVYIAVLDDGGAPVALFAGSFTLPDGTTTEFACTDQGGGGGNWTCAGNSLMIDTDAASIELAVYDTVTMAEYAGTITPDYVESQPNGPDCPPVCEQADVEIELTGCGDCG